MMKKKGLVVFCLTSQREISFFSDFVTPDQELNFRIIDTTPFISDKMTFLRARLSSTFASGVKNLSSRRFASSLSSKLSIDKVDVKGKRV